MLLYKPSLERLGIQMTRAHRRRRAIREPAAAVGLRHDRRHLGRSRCRPATSSAATGVRRPPTSRARATRSASRIPAVDALIERLIFAKNRADLVAATKALDRVLLWNHYVVPQWTYGKVRTARWDRFGHPDPLPKYGASAFPTIWWWDADKAAKVGSRS